ncbi:flavin-containing monooxygenase [Burkholderia multivorans]|nr:NAD(P)/FAD-dependent oxidoreductase [Burkholderia multivorans]MBN6731280.1 FAD-dependent oxidoreductase [Burkholderia multivorans]MBN8165094.1 FAD-dependent oxidoreductase [Burkholderia multivorans]QSL26998.1 FAD-dependent oxidoreductase [Burkholderia multivorans]QSL32797.1 FAD-dependent oxidoreductase [Burkholderia multivorans]QSL38540.1 FAD-dependent oxidoreductase [Burkholderia multivorans]
MSTPEINTISTAWPDEEYIRRALAQADPNILRLTLHHLTGDPELAAMRVLKTPLWAGALFTYTLAPEHHETVRQMAFDYLVQHGNKEPDARRLAHETVRKTMNLFGHGELTDSQFALGLEEAAFDAFPREVKWTKKPSQETLDKVHIVVVGAGISGIAAAVHLEQLGLRYTVLERQSDLGGAWHSNRYPEVRVDSTSLIYQYKFEKRYPWKEFFASGGETHRYLKHCAEKYNVADKIMFDTEVLGARWDEAAAHWKIDVRKSGEKFEVVEANFVISASGLFSTPKLPDIPGLDSFEGEIIHTTQWNDDIDLAGKRVAQIGTGASGAQLMPHIARHAKSVAVFQRTANWVLPMEGYRANISEEMHWLFANFPLYWNWYSYGMYFLNAQLEGLQEFDPEWQASGGAINERNDALRDNVTQYIRDRLADRPDLIDKVIPKYPPMARRPTVDNGWYDALLQTNVELVTDRIDHVTPHSIVTGTGDSYECDLIVCAAGFSTLRYLWPATYVGRDGATLDSLWKKDGPRAYLGMTMPGFPNFFMFYGPSSQGRSGSFHSMSEMWSRYALKCIVHVIETGASSIECKEDAFAEYNERLDEANKKVIWEAYGKGFYYLTEEGRSVVNSPWRGPDYHAMLYQPDFGHYRVV